MEETAIVKSKPWDYLGHDIDDKKSTIDNLRELGLDYDVISKSLYYNDIDDSLAKLPKKEAIIRADNGDFIAEAKEGSVIIQNRDAFNMLEPLQKEFGATIEKMGVDTKYSAPFVICKMPTADVLGEPVDPYMVIRNFQNGTKDPLRVFSTPIRVWCQNQLSALENAKSSVVFKTSTFYNEYQRNKEVAESIFNLMLNRQARLREEAERFAKVKISDMEFQSIADEVFPTDEEAGLRASAIAKNNYYKNNLLQAYMADDINNVRGTAYGVINAFADFSQHTPSYATATQGADVDYDNMLSQAQFTVDILQTIRYMMIKRYGVKFN